MEHNLSPMSETAYYILLSLLEERHGYGIMQYVAGITANRINIGAGTIYGTLGKLEKSKMITTTRDEEKRKYYQGLPVTTSAFILPFAFALRYVIFGLDYLYGTLMLITGILFVVDFKVPKLKGKGLIALGVLVVVELVQILCFS